MDYYDNDNGSLGYKLCYSIKNKRKKHICRVSNSLALLKLSLDLLLECIAECYKYKEYSQNLKWYILPLKNKREYKRLWKGCPF